MKTMAPPPIDHGSERPNTPQRRFNKIVRLNPFQFIFPWLKLLSLCAGFPLKILYVSPGFHRVTFQPCRILTVFHWINLLMGWGVICIMIEVLSKSTVGISVKMERLREAGFTVTHLVCAVSIFVPNVFSKTIFFLVYRKFGPALESFYELLSNNQSIVLPRDVQRRLYNSNCKHIICLISFGFASATTSACCCYFFVKDDLQPPMVVLAVFLWLCISLDIYFPPLAASQHLLTIEAFGIIYRQLQQYAKNLDSVLDNASFKTGVETCCCSAKVSRKKSHELAVLLRKPLEEGANLEVKVKELLAQGFHLVRILISAEATFGKFVFTAFSISLTTFVFGTFFSILILIAFGMNQFNWATFSYGLFPFLLACMNFLRLFWIIQTGESVKKMSKVIKNCLDKLLIDHCGVLPKSVRQQIKVLRRQTLEYGTISPMSAFELSNSSGLSITGVLVTYIIILFQFKISE